MIYYFDSDIAAEVGVNAAVILQNIAYWVKKNEANGMHLHDGRYWTFNSRKAFQKLYPFWTERVIKYSLKKLKDEGYILTQQFNKSKMDHTNWYALTDKGEAFFASRHEPPNHQGPSERTKSSGRAVSSDQSTNNTNRDSTDSKPYARDKTRAEGAEPAAPSSPSRTRRTGWHVSCPFINPSPELAAAWCGFEEMRHSTRKTLTQRAADLIAKKVQQLAPGDERKQAAILDQSVAGGWQGVYPLKTGEGVRGSKGHGETQTVEEMYEEAMDIMKRGGLL